VSATQATALPTTPGQALPIALYDHLTQAGRYLHRTRDEAMLRALRTQNIEALAARRILELGCGVGSLLKSLIAYGATPDLLAGIDPNVSHLRRARNASGATVAVADGALLPYRDAAFDLVFIFTALSSMVDIEVRRHAAHEALRVLRPSGMVLVYDFRMNPFNSHVLPVSPSELQHIFEPHHVNIDRVTLAPPLVRLLGGRDSLCRPLEHLVFLHTHMLASITKEAIDA